MKKTLSVVILGMVYKIVNSADPLWNCANERCKSMVDHDEHAIWIDPEIDEAERLQITLSAVSFAWTSLMSAELPLVS